MTEKSLDALADDVVIANATGNPDLYRDAVSALIAGVRANRRFVEIGQAVNRASGELPEGWDLHVELENGAGTVRLYDPSGDEIDEEFHDHDSFGASITQAVEYAVDAVLIK